MHGDGHRGALDPQHVRHQLLRKTKPVASDTLVDRQKPSRQAGLNGMQTVAGRRLSRLDEAGLGVSVQQRANGGGLEASRP